MDTRDFEGHTKFHINTIRENSTFRTVWDFLIVILILASCALIPYQIVFRHVAYRPGTVILYLIDFFFLVDILLNFFTSYRHEGTEITDPKMTINHYLKTLFVIDLLANLPFDAIFLGSQHIQIYGISIVLVLRMLRLLRVVRLFVIFNRWGALSWINAGFLRIIKFLAIIMLLIHWMACAWYLTAFIDSFPEDSWVVMMGIKDADPITQYIRSLYWAIVTMTTVGYGDITPHRNIEYLFTMLVMLLGASMYAFIIGNIASLISNLDATKANFWNRVELVNQYLRSRHLPPQLNQQVRKYYEYLWAHHRGQKKDDLFDDLPVPFRTDIMMHLTRELLEKVPLFKYCSPTLRNMLLIALKPQTFAPKEYIVREGEVGKEIYFISQGKAEIMTNGGEKSHSTLEDGDYFGIMSLILNEKRTASVKAVTYCEIFILSGDDFNLIKNDYPELNDVLKKISSEQTEKLSTLVMDGIVL
jgi:voltage-gated potassium channel